MLSKRLLLLRCLLFFFLQCTFVKGRGDKQGINSTDLLGPNFARACVPCVGACDAESPECLELALLGGNFAGGFRNGGSREGDGSAGGLCLEVVRLSRNASIQIGKCLPVDNVRKSRPSWACQPCEGTRSGGPCMPAASQR